MFVEPDLEQIEEVTAQNISPERTGTEPRSQIKSSELIVANDYRQDPRVERGAVHQTEFEWLTVKKVQSDQACEASLKQRILRAGIEFGADFDEVRDI
jgi:hypothetical protein